MNLAAINSQFAGFTFLFAVTFLAPPETYSQAVYSQPYAFWTLAGMAGSPGSADGVATNALFNSPYDVARDSAGNWYVADADNHTIRKVAPDGVVSTLAGRAGLSGSSDGAAGNARFYHPIGVATDNIGNVYVSDAGNYIIRKITPAGMVSTLAGRAGLSGSTDATGGNARFGNPCGLTVDSVGNLYVADSVYHTIRKITPAGVVTTLAGLAGTHGATDGAGTNARFYYPCSVAVDSTNNLYVADSNNSTIRKITPEAVVSTLAGLAGVYGSADGTGAGARFKMPTGVGVDAAGNVYVADSGNHTIRKITTGGVVNTLAGLAGTAGYLNATGSNARFNQPVRVATDTAGNIYVADASNQVIRRISSGAVVSTFAGQAVSAGSSDGMGANARFKNPCGVALDTAGNAYITDTDNHTVRRVSSAGLASTLAGLAGTYGSADGVGTTARFRNPLGVAADTAGNIFVADSGNHTIRKITIGGAVSTVAGLAGSLGSTDGTGSAARFAYPYGLALDSAGNLYTADHYDHTIRKITPGGVVTTLAGLAGSYGSADGAGSAARFNNPHGVAADSLGNLYVADSRNYTIRKITSDGLVTTLAGLATYSGYVDANGYAARFGYPSGVAVDSGANIYVTDSARHTIRVITPAGEVSTVAGKPYTPGSDDGSGADARFNTPYALAATLAGNLCVVDTSNQTVRVGQIVPGIRISPLAGQVVLAVTGPVGMACEIQCSTGLAETNAWRWLTNLTITSNPEYFVDTCPPATGRRFYRAVWGSVDMEVIPAGTFAMGNSTDPAEGSTNELPVHSVYVSSFCMDKYLVTSNLWLRIQAWSATNGYGFDNSGSGKGSNHPVQMVSWYDAVKWCNARSQKEGLTPCYYTDVGLTTVWKTGYANIYVKWNANGYRLPTEAEWEKAARGGAAGHRFPWSDSDAITHDRANYSSSEVYGYDTSLTRGWHPAFSYPNGYGMPFTSPVGSFLPNGYGLYDMAGNVLQFCWDYYDAGWYSAPGATQDDTRGPATGDWRVVRGGCWGGEAPMARCSYRIGGGGAMGPSSQFGFRCVRRL